MCPTSRRPPPPAQVVVPSPTRSRKSRRPPPPALVVVVSERSRGREEVWEEPATADTVTTVQVTEVASRTYETLVGLGTGTSLGGRGP